MFLLFAEWYIKKDCKHVYLIWNSNANLKNGDFCLLRSKLDDI